MALYWYRAKGMNHSGEYCVTFATTPMLKPTTTMSTTKTQSHVSVEKPEAWQTAEGAKVTFNADEVHDAYLSGKSVGFADGINETERAARNFLKEKKQRAAGLAMSVLTFLKGKSLPASKVYLRVVSWDELNVLILMNEEHFMHPVFKQVYDLVYSLEDVAQEEDFRINFSFAPYASSMDEMCLKGDGYTNYLKADFIEKHI